MIRRLRLQHAAGHLFFHKDHRQQNPLGADRSLLHGLSANMRRPKNKVCET
jgi:hypothetical protein